MPLRFQRALLFHGPVLSLQQPAALPHEPSFALTVTICSSQSIYSPQLQHNDRRLQTRPHLRRMPNMHPDQNCTDNVRRAAEAKTLEAGRLARMSKRAGRRIHPPATACSCADPRQADLKAPPLQSTRILSIVLTPRRDHCPSSYACALMSCGLQNLSIVGCLESY